METIDYLTYDLLTLTRYSIYSQLKYKCQKPALLSILSN